MEHECTKCNWSAMDNNGRAPSTCPKCGGHVNHFCDEFPEKDDEDDEDDLYEDVTL
jgi:predicted  nucleic acid-binding Zn-ribbon protein